jgi:DNA repair protein RadC
LPRPRSAAASETVRELLAAFDSSDPQDREALRETLIRLHTTLLASRNRLERHLRLFPEHLLFEAWEQAQHVTLSRQAREAAQIPLDFSAAPPVKPPPAEAVPAFQAADRPDEYRLLRPVTIDEVFAFVRQELERQFFRPDALTSPEHTKRYLIAELAREEREVFAVLFLDNRHRPLALEKLFYGTIDGCSVHPREVVRRALQMNAAATIFSHNHPSGVPEPSAADRALTAKLKEALALIDVRVLDHIIVAGTETVSFAERGLL